MDNVRDEERMPSAKFQANPGTLRMVIDYPFDEGNRSPAEDVRRVHDLKAQLGDEDTLVWLPHFLSGDRLADLSTLIVINYVLERDRLAEVTPTWTADDRHHARTQLESRRGALTVRLKEALRRAYGVLSPDDADLGARAIEQVLTLARIPEPRLLVGQEMKAAFHRLAFHLLDHRFPGHPDFDPNGTGRELRSAELDSVAGAVDLAAQDKVGRYEVPRGDVATLKKIANPLKLGVMHEQAFVLLHEWPDLINRRAAGHPQVTVAEIRNWIKERAAGPACPGAEPRDRLLLDPGEQGVAARRPPGARAGEGGSGHRRPGAAQPGAADRRRVRRGVQAGPGDLPGAAGAGAQRPVGPGDRPDSLGQGRRTALGG